MKVWIMSEFYGGHGYVIPYIEGECEPPMIRNEESQVFVQLNGSDEGILITEPENASAFVIERASYDEGAIFVHKDALDGVKIEKRLVVET